MSEGSEPKSSCSYWNGYAKMTPDPLISPLFFKSAADLKSYRKGDEHDSY
jgi:hypothetical protein